MVHAPGPVMEGFSRAVAATATERSMGIEDVLSLAERHGIEMLGLSRHECFPLALPRHSPGSAYEQRRQAGLIVITRAANAGPPEYAGLPAPTPRTCGAGRKCGPKPSWD